MRGAHRKLHVVFWATILVATAAALAIAVGARPSLDPTTEIPAAVAEEAP